MSLTPLASASCCAGVNDQGRARELLAEALRVAACSITNPRGQDSALESVVRVLSEQDPVTAESWPGPSPIRTPRPGSCAMSRRRRPHEMTSVRILPCCGAGLSNRVVTMTFMSELPACDTHDVIHHGGEVVAVVVPIAEYRQLRQAAEEQRVNEEFDATRAEYLVRRESGTIRYVSHEEAGRRLGMPSR